ncbi:MAG: hypothetical protein U5L04_00025 [Trueperaceae bacterium]|nr:hypothetical protein [Trueperaceae bacterium]
MRQLQKTARGGCRGGDARCGVDGGAEVTLTLPFRNGGIQVSLVRSDFPRTPRRVTTDDYNPSLHRNPQLQRVGATRLSVEINTMSAPTRLRSLGLSARATSTTAYRA